MMIELIKCVERYGVINPEMIAEELNFEVKEMRNAIETLKCLGFLESISMKTSKCEHCKHKCF